MNTHELGNDDRLSSRAQAIRDGRLIDITRQAGRVGFRVPVAISRAALTLISSGSPGPSPTP